MSKFYEAYRGLFWLFTCIIAGIVWGLFNSSSWGGLIYGGILFFLALVYEVFLSKRNSPKS
jgi:hypothetical protein